MSNLIEGIKTEVQRVQKIIEVYESLPKNAGAFAARMMSITIEHANDSMNNGDTVSMIYYLKMLQEYEL